MTTPDKPGVSADHSPSLRLEPLPAELLDRPLDYILADHGRQRAVCAALRGFAERGEGARADAASVLGYLTGDLETHHRDEEEDLFPALRRRAAPEDNLARTLDRLGEDHRETHAVAAALGRALAAAPCAETVRFARPARRIMQAHAASQHRHLAVENGVVLALARIRLTRGDLTDISRAMKARRGGDC